MSSHTTTCTDITPKEKQTNPQEDNVMEEDSNSITSTSALLNTSDKSSEKIETPTDTTTSVATVSESDTCASDIESSDSVATSSITSTQEQQDLEEESTNEEDEDDLVAEVRRSISKGLNDLTSQQRTQITEEVHGIANMGLSEEEELKPYFISMRLKQFQDAIDCVLLGSDSVPSTDAAAYELCLRHNYLCATNESEELRLLCLRAEMWNPIRACERFLKHLSALYKYYGEVGLKHPVNIDFLDFEERNQPPVASTSVSQKTSKKGGSKKRKFTSKKGVYKKGTGGCKRKGSLDSLPDMLELKSGSIQVLPSRDRFGRRVVVLQPEPSIATSLQTQLQVQKSKFKAIFYFLFAFLRRDFDAQRRGFVLILNSTKTDEKHNEEEYNVDLIHQYKELCESIPFRISALHFAYDKGSNKSIPHKICMTIVQSFIENNPLTNVARIKIYDEGVSNETTRSQIAPFGIATHQIPLTHTGTIKLKEHCGWVKNQEWYDKKYNTESLLSLHTKFNIIECPSTNDVLFSQGGKYWNGVNRFQRGNLEFMEFLESNIDLYQSTLSWKKKHGILLDVVSKFAQAPQSTGSYPRFLETATQIEGVTAPDGCWVELPLNSPLLMQKIRQTLLNHIRRLETSGKRKPVPKANKSIKQKKGKKESQTKTKKNASSTKKTMKTESPKKKRKIVYDSTTVPSLPHSVMKDNKLAMETFGNSLTSSFTPLTRFNNSVEASLAHRQSICEFLANAERIAVETAAVELSCENKSDNGEGCSENDLEGAIANDEKLVQAIIANDDRLNKEVGELFEMNTFLRSDNEDGAEHDEIADCLLGCMF